MHASGSLLHTVTRVPVHAVPHLWSPVFLQRTIDAGAAEGLRFGFEPREPVGRGWRVGIFEPNIAVVKNGLVPMLACEQAYRADKAAIDFMMVMNSVHMKDHPSFNSLALGLDLTKDSRASYEPRIPFAECMARHSLDAVVAHQWECELNYLYYDALYGGYPLFHNSGFLRRDGVGIYYDGFSAAQAATVMLEARTWEAGRWREYRAAARSFLEGLAPEAPGNIREFERLLAA
jgi:hypothetical protein